MPKVKPKRHTPSIDMTAMVDVAFLLLTFFILTANFRAEEKDAVVTPGSVSDTEVPKSQFMITSVEKDGKLFVGYGDQPTRELVFDMILNYLQEKDPSIRINDIGKKYFILQPSFGVPLDEFPIWLNLPVEQMKIYPQRGIHYPYTERGKKDNQLLTLVTFNQYAMAMQGIKKGYKFMIKGDGDAPVIAIQEVISSFQDVNINKFYLVTNLEEVPTGEPGAASAAE